MARRRKVRSWRAARVMWPAKRQKHELQLQDERMLGQQVAGAAFYHQAMPSNNAAARQQKEARREAELWCKLNAKPRGR